MSRRPAAALLLIAVLTASVLAGGTAQADDDGRPGHGHKGTMPRTPYTAPELPTRIGAGKGDSSWTQTHSFARQFVNNDGSTYDFLNPLTGRPYAMTVNVDHTTNLRGRERVQVTWSGAQPSAGRASDPYGVRGLTQEYPVVVMQCRGQGDQVRPETCWTSSVTQRSQVGVSKSAAVWIEDEHADAADKDVLSGMNPMPEAAECPAIDRSGLLYTHVTPFVAASGKVYSACDAAHMPPEAAVDSAFPPAEINAFTDSKGNGSLQFEVRSSTENESLGCSQKTPCSIVVVPIQGISCERASSDVESQLEPIEQVCRKTGQFEPGSSNFVGAPDAAVSPAYWWSASNWANRFVVPITFGPPPDVCDLLDKRSPTGFYGSELLAQAALQWSPAYCLNKKRFKFQMNQMPDVAGFQLMSSGEGAAAMVSSQHESSGDPIGYAPTAITGFGIGYVIDRPGNAGEYTELRLNARLLAKLMTLSYAGSTFGAQHPGMASSPWGIMADPEFIKLNPGLDQTPQEAGATLLSLSNSSDIIEQLTEYIAQDKDAMAFVNGKADPWGMRVNPSYKKLKLPTSEWPLLDDFVPAGSTQCQIANPSTYFNNIAAPVTSLRKISDALLDGWPNVQTRCDTDISTTPPTYKLGRVERQPYGSRFILGVVSLGDADRFGLRSAALQTKPNKFVAPSTASMTAAVELMKEGKKRDPYRLDQAQVQKSSTAYPGTMLVYTAAKTQNLDKKDAAKVAQFIRIATTEGQRPGSGNGELPGGFVPIRNAGATKRLFARAQVVANAIEKQQAPAAPADGAAPAIVTPAAPDAAAAEAAGAPPAAAPAAAPAAIDMPPTQAVSSQWGGRLLPVLFLLGVVFALVSAGSRGFLLWSRRR